MSSTEPQAAPPFSRRARGGSAASFAVGLAAGAAAGYAWTGRRSGAARDARARAGDQPQEDAAWPQVLEALRTGVCVVDAHDQISHANSGARELGVCEAGRLAPAELRALARHVRSTGTERRAELELHHGDETAAVRVHISPLPEGHVAVELTDISELHRVERVRRDFVANVSHELKTPVGALQLLSEALADAVDDPQAAARFTARIQHESARMGRLVSELLELSRLQGAEPMPAPVTVGIDRVITEALDRGRTAASAKDINLVRTGTRGLTVSGSENQLATALGNLVGNAIAYSPENTTVTVETTLRDDCVRIAVTDEGIGIAADELDRIFERFYRADPARSRATGGTGLGLAIVKHIAGNHGGRVEVSSMPGNGATFTLALPSVTAEAGKSEPYAAEINTQANRT